MRAPQETDLRAYWQQSWSSVNEADPRDVWYAIDEVKFGYLRRYLPPGGRSLEVGCGSARVSGFLAALGFEVVGLDYEVAALRLAGRGFQSGGVKGDMLLGDAFALPFADQSFDVVLSTGLLEHFADPSPIVAEMARVLRCGGIFYSDIVPRKFSLFRALDSLLSRRDDLWERPFDKGEIEALLSNEGLCGITVFAAAILPPLVPFVRRWRPVDRLQDGWARLFYKMARRWDGTKAAEVLGLYYFACAEKPSSPGMREAVPQESMTALRAA